MLNKLITTTDIRYFETMIRNCATKIIDQWGITDDEAFKNKLPADRYVYLKKWFCCDLCLLDNDNCPVFQEKLNC